MLSPLCQSKLHTHGCTNADVLHALLRGECACVHTSIREKDVSEARQGEASPARSEPDGTKERRAPDLFAELLVISVMPTFELPESDATGTLRGCWGALSSECEPLPWAAKRVEGERVSRAPPQSDQQQIA